MFCFLPEYQIPATYRETSDREKVSLSVRRMICVDVACHGMASHPGG
jgi:hypothetical protein